MTKREAESLLGQRGGRVSERRPPAASPSAIGPDKAAAPRPHTPQPGGEGATLAFAPRATPQPGAAKPAPAAAAGPARAALARLGPLEIITDVEQGTQEWRLLKRGVPSASRFAALIAAGADGTAGSSKTRQDLLRTLAGEILSGEPAEKFRNADMERGTAMEAEAREHYERMHFTEIKRVAFMRRKLPSGRYVGCSPDGLVNDRKAVEIKTMRPDLLIEVLDKGARGFPSEHRAQLQGTLWIADLEEIDLFIFYRGMRPAKFTINREERFIEDLAASVEVFDWELHRLVERLR